MASITDVFETPAGRALVACTGKILTTFTLAQIKVLNTAAGERDAPYKFDNDFDCRADGKPWRTYDDLVADVTPARAVYPVAVALTARVGLASLLLPVADAARAAPTEDLLRSDFARSSAAIKLMRDVADRTRPQRTVAPMCRDLGHLSDLCKKFDLLVAPHPPPTDAKKKPRAKKFGCAGAEGVLSLYFDALKGVAWCAAVCAYETGRLSLSHPVLCGYLRVLSGPENEDGIATVRDAAEEWDTKKKAAAKAKTKTKSGPPKKRGRPKKVRPEPDPPSDGASPGPETDPDDPEADPDDPEADPDDPEASATTEDAGTTGD